jgi:transposase
MPKRFRIKLTPEQRHELERVRDTNPRPYMRERAAAILKIADGQAARQVAQHGLLKRRDEDTVAEWVQRYLAEGLAGLQIKPGRGRKPAFSPSAPNG